MITDIVIRGEGGYNLYFTTDDGKSSSSITLTQKEIEHLKRQMSDRMEVKRKDS